MRDYITIGPVPADEECAQVGSDDYMKKARPECRRFIELIRKKFGPEPFGAELAIKSNPHDFGSYLDVVCYFEEDTVEAVEYAYAVEGKTPQTWDDETPVDWKVPEKSILQEYKAKIGDYND